MLRRYVQAILLASLFAFLSPAHAAGDAVPAAKAAQIRKLLHLTGADRIGQQIVENMFASYRKMLPQVPAKFWDEALKEMQSSHMVELVIPVYAKHFSDADIQGLIAFYQGPLGRKVVKEMPAITQESFSLGQAWGRAVAEKVKKRLVEEGYIKA